MPSRCGPSSAVSYIHVVCFLYLSTPTCSRALINKEHRLTRRPIRERLTELLITEIIGRVSPVFNNRFSRFEANPPIFFWLLDTFASFGISLTPTPSFSLSYCSSCNTGTLFPQQVRSLKEMDPKSTTNGTSTTALVVSTVNGPFEVKDVQLKEMRPDEILVKIVATGICHTDIATATVRYMFTLMKALLKNSTGEDRP